MKSARVDPHFLDLGTAWRWVALYGTEEIFLPTYFPRVVLQLSQKIEVEPEYPDSDDWSM
jgi:hypothetical protein